MKATTCPSRDQLDRFLNDLLSGTELFTVTEHVNHCQNCQHLLEEMTPLGQFAPRVQTATGLTADFLQHLKKLNPTIVRLTPSSERPARDTSLELATEAIDSAQHQWVGVPGYDILGILGRGGEAVVYQARHQALGRIVALKRLRSIEHRDPEEINRFRREAETLARLHHPNIVQVYEVGVHEGQPFFSLEYVDGGSLANRLQGQPQDPAQAAGLVHVLACAIHAAHEAGVVHRDLKPGNVLLATCPVAMPTSSSSKSGLVTPRRAKRQRWGEIYGIPKISDFGLAKHFKTGAGFTQTGVVLGTPSYMAPEQAQAQAITPACDLYALGAILYEMLTGRPPFVGAEPLHVLSQVVHDEPVPPRRLVPAVPRDLETICLKCLEKDPSRRYADASELAEDLYRFLNGEPIQARRVGPLERAWKWGRKRPAIAALLASVALSLIGGTALSSYFAVQAHRLAVETLQAKREIDLRAAELELAAGLTQAEAGAVDRGLFQIISALRSAPADARVFRRAARLNLAGWASQLPMLKHAFKADSNFVLRLGNEATFVTLHNQALQPRDFATGQPLGPPFAALPENETPSDLSPDGRLVSTFSPQERTALVRTLSTGQPVGTPFRHRDYETGELSYTYVLFAGGNTTVSTHGDSWNRWWFRRFWDLTTGKELPLTIRLQPSDSYRVLRTEDGKEIVAVFRHFRDPQHRPSPSVEFFDPVTGQQFSSAKLVCCGNDPAISWDGRILRSISGDDSNCGPRSGCDGAVWSWDPATGGPQGEPWRPRRTANYSLFSADGRGLAARGMDHRLRLFDLPSGLQRGGDLPAADRFTVAPNGTALVTAAHDGTVRLWHLHHARLQLTAAANPRSLPEITSLVPNYWQADVSPDGSVVAISSQSGFTRLVRTDTGQPVGPPLRYSTQLPTFSPDGRILAMASPRNAQQSPAIFLWDVVNGKQLGKPIIAPKLIHGLGFSPDGKTLAVTGVGVTLLVDVASQTIRHSLWETTCGVHLAFSPDNRYVAVGFQAGWPGVGAGFRVYELTTGQPVMPFFAIPDQDGQPVLPHFTPDGGSLVAYSQAGYVLTYDLRSGESRRVQVPRELGSVAAFRPDGAVLAIGYANGTVQQWDIARGQRVGPPLTAAEPVDDLRYSPAGDFLAVCYRNGTVRLWDAESGYPIGPPIRHAWPVLKMVFSPDNRSLVTVTRSGTAFSWPLPEPVLDDPDLLVRWLEKASGQRYDGTLLHLLDLNDWQACQQWLAERWPQDQPQPGDSSSPIPAFFGIEWGEDLRSELFSLNQLTTLYPSEWYYFARRCEALLRSENVNAADQDLARAMELNRNATLTWCRHLALTLAVQRRWQAARWCLEHLIAAEPDDWQLYVDRAEVYGKLDNTAEREADLDKAIQLGANQAVLARLADERAQTRRWAEAAALYARVLQQAPANLGVVYRLALLRLRLQDSAGYRKLCNGISRNLPSGPAAVQVLNLIAWICCLSPDAVNDYQPLLQRLRDGLESLPEPLADQRPELLNTQGALEYRLGQYAKARQTLEEAIKLRGRPVPQDLVFLAMIHHRLGDASEARRLLQQAQLPSPETRSEQIWQQLEQQLLYAEAQALLQAPQ